MVSIVNRIAEPTKACLRGNELLGAQGDETLPPAWILHVIIWGTLTLIILGVIVGIVLAIQGRRIRRKATEAGIDAPLPPRYREFKPFGIHEIVWGIIGLIILGVAWLVAPIIRASFPQLAINTALTLILAGLVWFFVFSGIVYILREYPKRQRLLEEAIRRKGAKPSEPTNA